MTWFHDLTAPARQRALALLDTPHGAAAREYLGDGDDTALVAWLATADRLCHRRYSLSIFDLPDFLWRGHHDDGMSPGEALAAAIDYARRP